MISLLLIKYSILSLYWRLFSLPSFRTKVYLIVGFVAAWAIAGVLGSILQCVPISLAWNPAEQGFCFNLGAFTLVLGVVNVITDFFILMLPVRLVKNLHLNRAKRRPIILIFCAGSS